jgi:error-prone DNA polymerase
MTSREALGAELQVLGINVTQHLMEHHHQLLREIGATDAAHLRGLRPGAPLVAIAGSTWSRCASESIQNSPHQAW